MNVAEVKRISKQLSALTRREKCSKKDREKLQRLCDQLVEAQGGLLTGTLLHQSSLQPTTSMTESEKECSKRRRDATLFMKKWSQKGK